MLSNRLVRLVLVAVIVVLAAATIREAIATSTVVQSIPVTAAELEMERSLRSRDADAARWNAAAAHFSESQNQAAEKASNIAAEAARWNTMAEHYLKSQSSESGRSHRSLDAETARWNAIAEYYSGK